MLKRFKQLYQKYFSNQRKLKQAEALEIRDHIVLIKQIRYFFAKAMITDIPEIAKVAKRADRTSLWNNRAFRNDLRLANTRLYLVLRRKDQMVAFIGCHFDYAQKDCHISNVSVIPEYQNRGLGYFLMTSIIKKSRSLKLRTVTLEVRVSNQLAINLYHDLGFNDAGVMNGYYHNDHEDALKMKLDITNIDDAPNNFGL